MKSSFSGQDCAFFCTFVLSMGKFAQFTITIFKAILVWYLSVTESIPCSIFQTRKARKPWGIGIFQGWEDAKKGDQTPFRTMVEWKTCFIDRRD